MAAGTAIGQRSGHSSGSRSAAARSSARLTISCTSPKSAGIDAHCRVREHAGVHVTSSNARSTRSAARYVNGEARSNMNSALTASPAAASGRRRARRSSSRMTSPIQCILVLVSFPRRESSSPRRSHTTRLKAGTCARGHFLVIGRVCRYQQPSAAERCILRQPKAAPGRPLIPPVPPPKRHPYDQWSPDARALDLVGDKWTLLIIRDLAAGPRRFVELQRVLPGISTEQLRSRLNRMVADGLLTRQRYREVPPRVDYELTERSRELIPVLGALARWGYDWTWSAPRPGEDINVGAIFRLAPGVLEPPAGLDGTVELIVDADGEHVERQYLVTFTSGRAEISEVGGASPSASVRGTVQAWVRALGPEGTTEALHLSGRDGLAGAVLDGFTRARAGRAAAAA